MACSVTYMLRAPSLALDVHPLPTTLCGALHDPAIAVAEGHRRCDARERTQRGGLHARQDIVLSCAAPVSH